MATLLPITITFHKDSREYWPKKIAGLHSVIRHPITLSTRTKELKNMAAEWSHDVDATLSKAKAESRPTLLDFSAAPA
jgi:hypothetical protein